MRPIDRGAPPREYTIYGQAIGDLEARLGVYCSYCERRLPASLAVEHMAPKSCHPHLVLDWNNFLLACVTCNSVKGKADVADNDVLWPDRHNTFLALAYLPGGFVEAAPGLKSDVRLRAQALIELVGLDRHDWKGGPKPTKRDERWQQREQIWSAAAKCLDDFEKLCGSDEALELLLHAAKGYGFFSVWLVIFDGHPKVKRALIDEFPGTAQSCFDEEGAPVARAGSII